MTNLQGAPAAVPASWPDTVRLALQESAQVKHALTESVPHLVVKAARTIAESLRAGGKLMLCGNGGSAADAQHLAAEMVGRLAPGRERAAMAAVALTTDTSILTALGNDYGFDLVFQRQVEAVGRAGDVLLGISTSGNSKNVIAAVQAAKARDIRTIGLLGKGGALLSMVDIAIPVPSDSTPRIQESHITLGHIMCQLVEEMYSANGHEAAT